MVSRIHTSMFDGGAEVGDYAISARSSKAKYLKCDGAAVSRTTFADLFAVIGTAFGVGDGSTTFNVPDPQGRALIFAGPGALAESFAAASVAPATDLITVQSNADRWITGMKVRATTTGTLPTGIALATDYYVIRVSATTIKLATSLANAIAGTAIDITAAGSGTHTLTHSLTVRAIGEKGGEEAHAMVGTENGPHNHGVTDPGHVHNVTGFANFVASTSSNAAYDDLQPRGGGVLSGHVISNTTGISIQNNGSGTPHNNMPPFLTIGNLFIYAGV